MLLEFDDHSGSLHCRTYALVIASFFTPLAITLPELLYELLYGLDIFILSIGYTKIIVILNSKWTAVSKLWYFGETDVTICLMDGLLC